MEMGMEMEMATACKVHGANPEPIAENKDTLCRNVLIYGHCRYEDQGCTFSHDQNKNNSNPPDMYVRSPMPHTESALRLPLCACVMEYPSICCADTSAQVSQSSKCRVSFLYPCKPAVRRQETNFFYTSRQCTGIYTQGARR